MNKFFLHIIIFFIVFPFQAFAFDNEGKPMDTIKAEKYQIKQIKRIRNVYVIYVLKDDKQYEIISPKGIKPSHSFKIKKGGYYELILMPYFEKNDYSRFRVTAIEIKGTLIPLESDFDYNIFLTTNLIGLYYVNPQK